MFEFILLCSVTHQTYISKVSLFFSKSVCKSDIYTYIFKLRINKKIEKDRACFGENIIRKLVNKKKRTKWKINFIKRVQMEKLKK